MRSADLHFFNASATLVGRAEADADRGDWLSVWDLMLDADRTIRHIEDPTVAAVAWERWADHYEALETRCLNEGE